MESRIAAVRDVLTSVFRDRLVVLAGGPAAGSTGRVASLRALGARRCLVLGVGRGTGTLPDAADAEVVQWQLPPATDLPGAIRAEERLFGDPPAPFLAALERFDPAGEALVLPPPFAALYSIADRPAYGGRRPEWVALEDKTANDELFAAAGVPTPQYEIVAATPEALDAASARLDEGAGTVWAGDARSGFNGGSADVRWVRDAADRTEAVAHLTTKCERVRVARFVEGIPCSVHGFVTDDGVSAFRPVELMTLRSATPPRLRFAGAGTLWDPPAPDREDMRDAARRLGARLRDLVAFRGAFTIDGILSKDGWVANECNPRFGAGLQYTRAACPALALDLLHHVVIGGDGSRVAAAELEAIVVGAADQFRWAATWIPTTAAWAETSSRALVADDQGYATAPRGSAADATLTWGPGPMGGFVRCEFDPTRAPIGPSTAPRAVAALSYADAQCGATIGPLTEAVATR